MGSNTSPIPKTWIRTPCLHSAALSRSAGCNVYLKLENIQPSGSFKSRGVGNMIAAAIAKNGKDGVHFYCSSGGNAGLACVTAAKGLGRRATIVVPRSTGALMREKLRVLGADLDVMGEHWSEADRYLREHLLAEDENGVYVPPFDHEDIWEGNASLIDELEEQMEPIGGYDAVVCSVGGGGLFCGIMQGLDRHSRLHTKNSHSSKSVKVLATETIGADSLHASVEKGQLVRIPAITSIATSLGATQVASKAWEWAQRPEVKSSVLPDAEAAMACVYFADDERTIVETSCGVSIATAYNGFLRSELYEDLSDEEFKSKNVVIVVCGGQNITLEILEKYRQQYGQNEGVLRKFGRAGTTRDTPSVEREEASQKVPFIMHNEIEHRQQEKPACDEDVVGPSKAAIGIMGKGDVEEQLEAFGKVVHV